MSAQAAAIAAAVSRAAAARGSTGIGTVPEREPVTRPLTAACAGEPVTTTDSRAASSIVGTARPVERSTGQVVRAPTAVPSRAQASVASSPAAPAARRDRCVSLSALAEWLIRVTATVATTPRATAVASATSSAARCARPGPTAAETQLRAAGGSLVTQIRTSQAATGSRAAAV